MYTATAQRHQTLRKQSKPNLHTDACHIGARRLHKNSGSHIDASLSRQPLVKGERLVRYEVNAVIAAYDAMKRIAHSSQSAAMVFALASKMRGFTRQGAHCAPWSISHHSTLAAPNHFLWQKADRQGFQRLAQRNLSNTTTKEKTYELLPKRVCCYQQCARPVQHVRASEQAQENASPQKN